MHEQSFGALIAARKKLNREKGFSPGISIVAFSCKRAGNKGFQNAEV